MSIVSSGFDAAHHAVSQAASTDFLILIDGDNWLVDNFVFDFILYDSYDKMDRNTVLNFKSINKINGLMYENGGVKIWPRHILANLQSHENSASHESNIDFCYSEKYRYVSKPEILSITDQSTSCAQAFSGGFRETVKQCLNSGVRFNSVDEFLSAGNIKLKQEKIFALTNIGADVQNGKWSIYGARLAFWNMWFNPNFKIENINDVDALTEFANSFGGLDVLIDFVDDLFEKDVDELKFGIPFTNFGAIHSDFIRNTFNAIHGTPFSHV